MNIPERIYHPEINGLWSFENRVFSDHRGFNAEIYNFIINTDHEYQLDSFSYSHKNVLRGMHGNEEGYKVISVLYGKVQLFVVDVDKNSSTYKNYKEFILDFKSPTSIVLPPKTLNGHLVLSENAVFYYKWEYGYVPKELQLHGKWNEFGLPWRISNPILSERDK